MQKISKLNLVFTAEVILFFLIIFGVLPRYFAFGLAGILVTYSLFASLEDATILFVRSIPLFIALPITSSFDNMNTWRIVALVIFARFIFSNYKLLKINKLLFILLLISILSIFIAQDKTAAIMRVIYFVNLSLVAIVIYYLPNKRRIIVNFIPPLVIVLVVGFFQLATTYFMDIYQFVGFWGWGAQCRQFGMEWCRIAVEQGNTWFAYNSFGQINLRMFSLFTDSHTFPMYILMAIPAVFAYAAERLDFASLKTALRTRARLMILLVPLGFLAAILSNTRGIWLAGWGITLVAFIAAIIWKRAVIRYLAIWLIAYLMMFAFVYPISATPQFHLYAGKATLTSRVKSILDFAETSNALRIAIWKASLRSMIQHPILGVGIGNFPVVLEQDIELAKAGSSAHNIYLQIGAELGIPALLTALAFFWLIFKNIYDKFRSSSASFDQLFFGALLITIPWMYGYLMTDAALFDERAFLMFSAVCATILGYGKSARIS
ncbi:MAG: O-antigen ligase family protein [Patescibacteria group bacterium]